MKLSTLFTLLVFVFGYAVDSLAQFTPVTAKVRSVSFQIQDDGSEVEVHRTEGSYYRSSSGSVMETKFHIQNGELLNEGTAHFVDSSSGKTYALDHRLNTATVIQTRPIPFFLPSSVPPQTVGEAVIGGLNCVATPVVLNGDVGNPVGKALWSVDNALLVKREYTIGDLRTVWELYEISFSEPTSSKFGVPSNYTVAHSQ